VAAAARQELPQQRLWQPLLQGPPRSSCPCSGSPASGHACGPPTRQILQPWTHQGHLQKTWRELGRAGEGRELLGKEGDGVVEWETPLESSKALKERGHEKPSWFNEPRWTVQRMMFRRNVPLTHEARHFGKRKSIWWP
jgi:hypothetical protein